MAAFATVGMQPAGAKPADDTWELIGHHQRACFDSHVNDAWYGVFVKGTWTHALDIGMKHLPADSSYSTSYAPVAAGSSNGQRTLAYGDAHLSPSTPVGKYTATLWASDGTTRHHVTVELDVKASCGY